MHLTVGCLLFGFRSSFFRGEQGADAARHRHAAYHGVIFFLGDVVTSGSLLH